MSSFSAGPKIASTRNGHCCSDWAKFAPDPFPQSRDGVDKMMSPVAIFIGLLATDKRPGAFMQYRPTFEEFAELAREASVVPVYRQLVGDTLTPVSAFCKIQEGEWAFLFESVVGGERLGRYSFLGSGPFLRFQAYQNRVRMESVKPGGGSPRGSQVEEFDHP